MGQRELLKHNTMINASASPTRRSGTEMTILICFFEARRPGFYIPNELGMLPGREVWPRVRQRSSAEGSGSQSMIPIISITLVFVNKVEYWALPSIY